jgi:5-methylcytosine-specific restriction endonuclease McrA
MRTLGEILNPREFDTPPRKMPREDYAKYRKSYHWKIVRDRVLARCNGICEGCHGRTAANVHHLTYERLGNEDMGDLLALCRQCHESFHNMTTDGKPPWDHLPPHLQPQFPPTATQEERIRAVEYWEKEVRPTLSLDHFMATTPMQTQDQIKAQALAHLAELEARKDEPIIVSEALRKVLDQWKDPNHIGLESLAPTNQHGDC